MKIKNENKKPLISLHLILRETKQLFFIEEIFSSFRLKLNKVLVDYDVLFFNNFLNKFFIVCFNYYKINTLRKSFHINTI
jgi:hypothetical protein